jgi:hypothetical protein
MRVKLLSEEQPASKNVPAKAVKTIFNRKRRTTDFT